MLIHVFSVCTQKTPLLPNMFKSSTIHKNGKNIRFFFENQVPAVWARARRTIVIGRKKDSARILESGLKVVN